MHNGALPSQDGTRAAPGVTGKSVDNVSPTMCTRPCASTARPPGMYSPGHVPSSFEPPKYVE